MSQNITWFTDRVGLRVYRGEAKCPCSACIQKFVNGFIITDIGHAHYLHTQSEEHGVTYYDSKEERNKQKV